MAIQDERISIFSSTGGVNFQPQKGASIDLIFPTMNRNYLNEYRLFAYHFGFVPNKISETEINVDQAREWFLAHYGKRIVESYYSKLCFKESKTAKLDDCIYLLQPDLMVYFDTQQSIVRYLFKSTEESFVNQLVKEINKFKEKRISKKPEIHLLTFSGNHFNTEKFELKQAEFSLLENYNDDLIEVNERIVTRLNTKNDKGLVLLHGEPGTGKTSYIRHLTCVVNKKVIFFPPNLADNITSPNLISFLIENPNSVLVIEDAENILLDRHYNDRSAVSALLNLSDGLLADCLSIQLICTFNTDVTKIDSALLRKGRLIASYKFEALEARKAQSLSNKLGFSTRVDTAMRLTDVFNQDVKVYEKEEFKTLGFRTY